MFYKVKYEDAFTGEHITQYVPVEDAREYFADLDSDPHIVGISAILVDYAPFLDKQIVRFYDDEQLFDVDTYFNEDSSWY